MSTVETRRSHLQAIAVHAKQLIDTISTVVDRLLDHYERDRQRPAPKAENGHAAMLRFDPAALPSLTHIKLRKAVLDGRSFAPNWNEVARIAIETGLRRLGGYEQLVLITGAHIVKGAKTE